MDIASGKCILSTFDASCSKLFTFPVCLVGKYVQKPKHDAALEYGRKGPEGSSRRYREYPAKKERAMSGRRSRAQKQPDTEGHVVGSRLLSKLTHSLSLCQQRSNGQQTSTPTTPVTASAD